MENRFYNWVLRTLMIGLVTALVDMAYGQYLYNPKTEICCARGRVFARNETTACCGSMTYNTHLFACCSERLFPLPVVGDPTFACCSWESKSPMADKPYHPSNQRCCNGKIRDLTIVNDPNIKYACCGDNLYNEKSHFCCNGRVFRIRPGEQCCSSKIYNTSRQACCGPIHPDGHGLRIVNFKGAKNTCCGFEVFDTDKESCCKTDSGSAIKGLPRGRPSKTANVECCNNVPFYNDRKGCCARRTYNTRTSVCCGDKTLRKPRGTQGGSELCCGSQLLTNLDTQLCHKGEIVPVPNRRYKSCGEDIIATGPKAEYGCCWDIKRKYRKKDQVCCNGVVVTMTTADQEAGKTSCCPR